MSGIDLKENEARAKMTAEEALAAAITITHIELSLDELTTLGYAIVPIEPSPETIERIAIELTAARHATHYSRRQAKAAYTAMIAINAALGNAKDGGNG